VQRTHVSTILIACLLIVPHFAFSQCTQTFTPSNVGTSPYPGNNVNTAVQNGNASTVLCFSSGAYGAIDLYGAHPSGIVTIMPASGAAATGAAFNLNGVSNLTVTGFSGTSSLATFEAINAGVTTGSDTYNLTVSNNHIIGGHIMIRDNQRANANVNIINNLITGFNAVGQGALQAFRNIGCPSGVVFQNNHVINTGGNGGDGIDTSGADCGTRFVGNEIEGVLQSTCPNDHCDGYQDFGGSVNEVVDGNYFHNDSDCVLLNDGTTNITFTNNVCVVSASQSSYAMQLTSNGLIFKHNTVIAPGLQIYIGNMSNGQSTSFVETDNIFNGGEFRLNPGQTIGGTGWFYDYNLCYSSGSCNAGTHSLTGTPTYVGGANQTTYAGFALTSGSLGHNAADDGKDMGISTTAPVSSGPVPPANLAVFVK
jgi:hypothetical protein